MRGKGRPFRKGESGNPGGRPRGTGDVRALARTFTDATVETMVKLMTKARSERVRLAAAIALQERGWGRPTQPVSGDDGGPIRWVPAFGDTAKDAEGEGDA